MFTLNMHIVRKLIDPAGRLLLSKQCTIKEYLLLVRYTLLCKDTRIRAIDGGTSCNLGDILLTCVVIGATYEYVFY